MRTKLKPQPIVDLRGFYRLFDGEDNQVAEASRFSDGRVVVAMGGGYFYPHASMADAQRVHAGMRFERV